MSDVFWFDTPIIILIGMRLNQNMYCRLLGYPGLGGLTPLPPPPPPLRKSSPYLGLPL